MTLLRFQLLYTARPTLYAFPPIYAADCTKCAINGGHASRVVRLECRT